MVARLDGKVGIVTGAAHGLGATLALALAREGAAVAAVDVCHDLKPTPYPLGTEKELGQVVRQIKPLGRKALALKCDVSKDAEVKGMVAKVVDEFGKIDILVNNAGVVTVNNPLSMTEEEWDVVLDVNLKGAFLCCKYVLPHMVAQKSGKVVNISSVDAREPTLGVLAYNCSKAGLNMLTDALSKEMAQYNLNINAVAPGAMRTPMSVGAIELLGPEAKVKVEKYYGLVCEAISTFGREVTTEDVASAVLFLASEESRNITGYTIYVDGGHKGYVVKE